MGRNGVHLPALCTNLAGSERSPEIADLTSQGLSFHLVLLPYLVSTDGGFSSSRTRQGGESIKQTWLGIKPQDHFERLTLDDPNHS